MSNVPRDRDVRVTFDRVQRLVIGYLQRRPILFGGGGGSRLPDLAFEDAADAVAARLSESLDADVSDAHPNALHLLGMRFSAVVMHCQARPEAVWKVAPPDWTDDRILSHLVATEIHGMRFPAETRH